VLCSESMNGLRHMQINRELSSLALVRKRTISTERPSHVGVVPNFEDRGCRVVSAPDLHGRESRFSRPGAATFPLK
jgi:hypothetical protein